MINAVLAAISVVGKIGGKMIPDADKKVEFAFKLQEMTNDFMKAMLAAKTYPWVDALVKLAYASEAIIKGLFRPVVASGLFIWGLANPEDVAKLQQFGVMGEGAIGVIFGSLPAWGVDRGLEKRRKAKKQPVFEDEEW